MFYAFRSIIVLSGLQSEVERARLQYFLEKRSENIELPNERLMLETQR